MRTTIFALSLGLATAACSDQRQPTSPNIGSGLAGASADAAPTNQTANAPSAKPNKQSGFTIVSGQWAMVKPLANALSYATCPVGSVPTGGGFQMAGNVEVLKIGYSAPTEPGDPSVGWKVSAYNSSAVLTDELIRAWVICAS